VDRSNKRDRAVRRVLWLTLLLNIGVAAAKIAYGIAAGSLAIRADGFHSLTDAVNNVGGLLGVFLSMRPPDPSHPYGHRKYEIVAATAVGLSLLLMAYDVAANAWRRLGEPDAPIPHIGGMAFVVLGLTLLVNIFVAAYERNRGRALESPFLLADAAHTRSDVLVTMGVIVATALVQAGYVVLDLAAAAVVAAFIAWAGIGVLRVNLRYLSDAATLNDEDVERVVLEVPGVASTHKIRTRGTPNAVYVDLHIQIAPHLDVVRAHRVTHWVIDAIKQAFPNVADVVVHTEPAAPGVRYKELPWEKE